MTELAHGLFEQILTGVQAKQSVASKDIIS